MTHENETVLVTGGSGYIAGFCIAELLNNGYKVRTTLRNLNRAKEVVASLAQLTDSAESLSFYKADLTSDAGWNEAVLGCDYVLHVASPLGIPIPKNPDDLIKPAQEGTARVINACIAHGVKRVVVTSSIAAARPTKEQGDMADESSWTDINDSTVTSYEKSKTLAEKKAFELVEAHQGKTTLATVNPSLVLGPVLGSNNSDSLQVVSRLLEGRVPGIPNLGFCIVDVRDVAKLHVLAMTEQSAKNERFLAAGDFVWMKDMADILRRHLGKDAKKVPNMVVPDAFIRFVSLFWRDVRALTPSLSQRRVYSSKKAQTLLKWNPRPMQETLLDCAHSYLNAKSLSN